MTQVEPSPTESSYLVLSADVRRVLTENSVSLADILARSNLSQAEAREVTDPERPPKGAREVVTIILATAAAVAVLTPLITQIIQAYVHRPVVVQDIELASILDGNGQAVRRADGEPVLVWQPRKRLLESSARPVRQAVSAKALGFEITLKQEPFA